MNKKKDSNSVNELWARMACVNEAKTRTSHLVIFSDALGSNTACLTQEKVNAPRKLGYDASGYPIVTTPRQKIHVTPMN